MLGKDHVLLLKAPFPKEKIKSRRGQGGVFQYLDGIEVENRLNEVFQGNWEWKVTTYDYTTIPNWIMCFGNLTVRTISNDGKIIKTTKSGEGAVKYTSTDDISLKLKAASTKALKAAASRFGVAREIEAVDEDGFTSIRENFQTKEVLKPNVTPQAKFYQEEEQVHDYTPDGVSSAINSEFFTMPGEFIPEPSDNEKLTPSQLTALVSRAKMLGKSARQLMAEGLGVDESSVPEAFEDLSRLKAKMILIASNPYK